jgi:hypothetical protein
MCCSCDNSTIWKGNANLLRAQGSIHGVASASQKSNISFTSEHHLVNIASAAAQPLHQAALPLLLLLLLLPVSCQGLFTPGNTLFELQKTDNPGSNYVSVASAFTLPSFVFELQTCSSTVLLHITPSRQHSCLQITSRTLYWHQKALHPL